MVAAADGAQLFSGDRFQALRHRNLPGRIVVEEVVVDGLSVDPAHTEGEGLPDLIHDGWDVLPDVPVIAVETDRLVAAGDVEPDARRADTALVGDDSADGDGITQMVVRHQGATLRLPGAILHLKNGVLLGIAPHRNAVDEPHLSGKENGDPPTRTVLPGVPSRPVPGTDPAPSSNDSSGNERSSSCSSPDDTPRPGRID